MRALATSLVGIAVLAMTPAASAALTVVATTADLADIARKVGGDRVDVEAICRGDQDPHFVEAKPSYMVQLARADLVVSVGLQLEIGWLPQLLQGARNPDINPGRPGFLDASTAIQPIEIPGRGIDRSAGDVHPDGNPHYWLDPENAKAIARLIAGRLAELDPEGAQDYRSRASSYVRRLNGRMAQWRTALRSLDGTKVVSYHRTFNYFLRRFGMTPVDYVEPRPGVPPSASHLASLIRKMRGEQVGIVLHESFYERRASDMVARRAGARIIVLPVSVGGVRGTGSYIRLIDHIVQSLVGE